MRLQELYIKDYKVLQDFTLRFDQESAVSVLIGENGSGKTTVIECLTLIFSGLLKPNTVSDLYKAKFPFSFRLRYNMSTGPQVGFSYEHEIRSAEPYVYEGSLEIQFEYEESLNVWVRVDGSDIYDTPELLSHFLQGEGFNARQVRYLLPSNIVLYYSGISTILEQFFDQYQQSMITDTVKKNKRTKNSGYNLSKVNPDLFYFKPENFPALLIGLLSFRNEKVARQLEREFDIYKADPFDRIVIKLHKPYWAKPKINSDQFWGAEGELATFLGVLRDRIYKSDFMFNDDSVTFTIRTPSQLADVWGFYGTEKSLFEYLVTLQANDLIDYIDVDLRKNIQLVVPYQRLSEGEKQFLIIMALRELFAAEDSLFLLDEPDTYLHPEWKRKFIANFQPEEPYTESFLAYYLITTHSPGLVSGMQKNQLHILKKENGHSVSKLFSFNPYGQPEDQILFDFFGITGLRYKPVEEKLNELRLLVNDGDYESDKFENLFQQLENELSKSDEGIIRLKLEIARRKRAAQSK
ncbi:AAA family ATPase [Spirosoma fluviale]|uniref:AAA ATPase domain-containing protein n=1 Tax=Spirosoma fluviale TaxID=1597977 RepID=A0A286G154_9BACT|nr:AAA family ATPase [Spirosoma fluviale]SOD89277.1 AAA ATPase domain-containing protein [Spirosoma fluviale]